MTTDDRVVELERLVAEQAKVINDMKGRLSALERRTPAGLSPAELEAVLKEDPATVLEVAATWVGGGGTFRFSAGQVVDARQYPAGRLADLVRSGLKLREPGNNSRIVDELRAQAQARLEVADADRAAASAARERRGQAEVDASRAPC